MEISGMLWKSDLQWMYSRCVEKQSSSSMSILQSEECDFKQNANSKDNEARGK
jgi:hypothetical protein